MSTDSPLDQRAADALDFAVSGMTSLIEELAEERGTLAGRLNHAASILDSGVIGDLVAQLVEAKHLAELARGHRSRTAS